METRPTSYASVLVHVQPDESVQYRLCAACAVAKRFDAFLIGVAVEMIRAAPFDDGYTSIDAQWFTVMRENALKSQAMARAEFDAAAAELDHGSLWIAGFDFPAPAIARAARGADLIVTGQPPADRDDSYLDAGAAELALISGRPVLVLEVCSQEDAADAGTRTADMVAGLARHGVAAEGKVTVGRSSAGQEIILEAETFGADLIVSGAYGHTRLGEWAFGGVTHELLRQDAHYVLLSH